MRVTIEPRDRSLFVQAIRATRAAERARTGLHCSTVVHDIAVANGIIKPSTDIDESTGLSFQELGNVIEDVVASALMARFPGWSKPAEIEYRGIKCNLDGWSPRVKCVDEVKACWKSENSRDDGPFVLLDGADPNAPLLEPGTGEVVQESPKFVLYKMQVLFYMAAAADVWGECTWSRLHVLFVNGNYRPPFPDPVTLRLRPTMREVDANRDLILGHVQDRGPQYWKRITQS